MPASNKSKSKSKSKSISIRIIITDILVNYKIQPGLLSANSSIDQVLKKIGDKMRKVFLALLSLMFTSLMAVTPPALGQAKDFPNRAIKIIVPFTAGSGSDTSARFFGEKMSGLLGQTVVVENRPGASGVIAVSTVKSAPADGHTILLGSISLMSVNPVTMKDLPYDPAKDLKPIAGLARAMAAIIVPQNSKLVTLADVVKASKDDKKSLSAGTYSAGYQLIFEWFANLAGIKFNHIPYKGGAAIYADLVGNQLDIAIVDVGGAASLIKSGKLRAIAMSGETRHPMFPEVPTVKESGFPEYVTYTWTAFSVRSETPDDITAKLADTMQKALATNDAKEYGRSTGGELMPYGPADMQKFQREELDRFRRIATIAGVKPQ